MSETAFAAAPAQPSSRKPKAWDGTMRFGIFWPGTRTLLPSEAISALNPDPLDLSLHQRLAQTCEAIGLDLVLLGDGYAPSSEEGTRMGFQDPGVHALTLSAALALSTKHLGIVSTLHSSFFHPAHLARLIANMDWMSGGRWGWNIVNGYRDYEASLFGIDSLPPSATMYDAVDEAIEIIESLWDPSRRTEFEGVHHRCHGKLKGPYPPERPLFVCAGASERGRQFTARHCEYMFASPTDLSDLPAIKADFARYATEAGKDRPPEALVVCDLMIRDEPGEARALFGSLMASIETNEAGKKWSGQIGKLRNENKTPFKFPHFVGTAAEVAEQLIEAYRSWSLTGVLFRLPVWSPEEVARLGPVFHVLEREGVWSRPETRGYSW